MRALAVISARTGLTVEALTEDDRLTDTYLALYSAGSSPSANDSTRRTVDDGS